MLRSTAIFLLLPAVVGAIAFPVGKIGVSDLFRNASKFDGKVISATGTVDKFEARTSRVGAKYFVFELRQGQDFAHVYGRLVLTNPPKNGARVQVTGLYEKVHRLRTFSVPNQIEVRGPGDIKGLGK